MTKRRLQKKSAVKCVSGRSGTNGIEKENIKITIPNAGSVNKMDNKTIQLDFKLLVGQSLNLLDSLDAVSQCDALHYLLRTLKCKYPEACERVTRALFPHITNEFASSTKTANKKQLQLQLLLTAKKEEIKTEDEGSTDLNQNFEKILCKEEIMCLDEDDDDMVGGMDLHANVENSSSNNRHLHYNSTHALKQDPLDLIPSSIINTRHLTKANSSATFEHAIVGNSVGAIARLTGDDSYNSWAELTTCDQEKNMTGHNTKNNKHNNYPRLLSEKLVLSIDERCNPTTKAKDDYYFYPDNEWTIHYHHSTGEFNVRAYKRLFRFRLQKALSEEHKPFLKKFYKNFILSGQLLGTRPPLHVLEKVREQRLEEWQQLRLRKLAAVAAAEAYTQQRQILPAITFDSELESESESQMSTSVAAPEMLKFEEITEDDAGTGRLVHGMKIEPDIEDVLGGGSSASGSGHSNSSNGGATTDLQTLVATTPESVSTMTITINNTNTASLAGGESTTSGSLSSNSKPLLHNQQQQQGNSNLVINGLTASNNINNLSYNNQQLANIDGDLPSVAPKEQNQQPQSLQGISTQIERQNRLLEQRQTNFSNQYLQERNEEPLNSLHFPTLNDVARENILDSATLDNASNSNININKIESMLLPGLNNCSNSSANGPGSDSTAMKKIPESLHNNVLNANQSHFLGLQQQQQQQQQDQQRLIKQNQKQDTPQLLQQHRNVNANLQHTQTHPLTLLGGMAESAQHQLQQQQQEQLQLQQHRMQQQSTNTAAFINSIDNILNNGSLPAVMQQKHPQQHFSAELLAQSPTLQQQGAQQSPLSAHAQMQQQQQPQQQMQHTIPMLHLHQQHVDTLQQQQQQQQQQQHLLLQQQQQQLADTSSASTVPTSGASSSMSNALSTTPSNILSGISASASTSGSISSASLNVSLGLDDNDLSHDEDDDMDEHDLDDMEPKQQLIDGGSSSSTSLQAPPGSTGAQGAAGTGAKKAKPSYQCLQCPKSYRKRKSLLDHYKIHPGFCHDCGQPNGTSLEEIIHHNRTVHAKEFPFVCDTCGESYSRRQQFHAHVESHSKKEFKTYSCIECGQKFPHKKLHQQHLDTTGHKADGAICEVCGADFPSKNALYQHIIRVHKKDNFFECHICQNRFTLKANLERHVQLHTEVKRTYVCDICGSSYFTYPALKDHYSNAHTDASECKCTLCGKRFGSVKSLQRHLPSHSEERPHCCCYCDQTFKWKTHMVRHKQTVHGNQPSPKKVKRFAKDEEMVPTPDMPGPPPAKVAKKSTTSKPKQQAQQQNPQQQQLQRGVSNVSTPPPLSTTPGTSQQDQFNASMISNSSSQSSTASASASQHSLSTNESQQNSMYTQSFNTEKLIGHQAQQQQQPQQQQQQPQQQQLQQPQPQQQTLAQVPPQHCNPSVVASVHHTQQQQLQQPQLQQQRPTPPPAQQQQHRRTPNTPDGTVNSGPAVLGVVGGNANVSGNNLMSRLNNFGAAAAGGVANITGVSEFHFDPNHAASAGQSNASAYQQHQLINQYQQQNHQQQQAASSATVVQQQQHLRSHTPQSPHQPHPQQQQQQQQHFTSPHHMPATQQQLHHHQQMLHHHQQMQQQHQQQHRHNQQRSPLHHATSAQQLQQQHHQPSHSPQRGRLQSPQPQQSPLQHQQQQQQQQQQLQQQQQQYALQQQANEAPWANIGFGASAVSGVSAQQPQPQQQQQPPTQQQGVVSASGELKDNPAKFYIVDTPDFLGLPMNVGSNGGPSGTTTPNSHTQQQQHQQQQQQQSTVGPSGSVSNKQQESQIGGELMSFQSMWPSAGSAASQMMFSGGAQQQQQQQQQQQAQQQAQSNAQSGQAGSVNVGAADPHNYNNIGSILTNLIDTAPTSMEYNFDIMQPGGGQMGVSQSQAQAQQQHPQNSLAAHQQQQQQQQSQPQHPHSAHHHQPHSLQQQHHSAAAAAIGNYGTAGLMRHTSLYGSPSGASLYDTSAAAAAAAHHHHHLPSHHPGLGDLTEQQQKNSFQPYHPHAASHSLGGHHPLAPTAHHPLAPHLLPPPPHASIYDRSVGGGYPAMLMGGGVGGGGDEQKTVLPPISDYMHHIQQQQLQSQHPQQSDLVYYPVKND